MDSLPEVDELGNASQCCNENDNQEDLEESGTAVKSEQSPSDITQVSVKVLWDGSGNCSLEPYSNLENDESQVKSELAEIHMENDEHSLSTEDSNHLVPDQDDDLINEDETRMSAEGDQMVAEDHDEMLPEEGHMIHVPEDGGTILAGASSTMQVATSLASALTAQSDHVIRLLLPSEESSDQPQFALSEEEQAAVSEQAPMSTVQAITLADGTTAFIQHPNGKFMEGQTITLEDGSTAVVQGIPSKLNLVTSSVPSSSTGVLSDTTATSVFAGSQPVQLDDGTTAYLNPSAKDSLQAIILEDGTTAYLATQQTPLATFTEIPNLSLDQLTTQVTGVQALLNNGILKASDIKPAVSTSTIQVQQVTNSTTEKSIPFGEKAYRCGFDDCGRLYTTLHHLKVHERSHTGDRPFKCDTSGCGKAFATGYGLKSHTRVHTGEKPYKCPESQCDKAFKTSGDLQKHLRTHTGERPFKCPFEGCKRSFTTSNIRKVHIRTHTGERPYVCPEDGCGRAFASATNYKNHIRIHTGEKPYVCTVSGCGKRFTEYSSLYKHHVVHTHSKPYACNHCGKTYRQTSTLAMHKRTSHGEDVTAESEAALFAQQSQEAALEPPEKRARHTFSLQPDGTSIGEEGEGTLIINTSENNHLTLVGADGLTMAQGDMAGENTLNTSTGAGNPAALLTQAGVATFTLGDQGQQVYVITDPAQLEALQQLAQHQFDADALGESSVVTTLPEVIVEGLNTSAASTSAQDIITPFENA